MVIPAAMENQINEKIAGELKAKIVVEAANGPTTVETDKILKERGIVVVPDLSLLIQVVLLFHTLNGCKIISALLGMKKINRKLKKI